MKIADMSKHSIRIVAFTAATLSAHAANEEKQQLKWLDATAYVVPKETATEGEGYFSIIEGLNRRLYIGAHANAVNSWLVEFDLSTKSMRIAVDAHKAIGTGPSGAAWCAVTESVPEGHLPHLVRYCAGDKTPSDLGAVAIRNPDFTEFTNREGKTLPFHAGFVKRKDGRFVNKYVILGVCEARDGNIYIMAMHPYSVLQVSPDQLR